MVTIEELAALGPEDVELCLNRGDWVDPSEIRRVRRWLQKAKAEQRFRVRCERANLSSALYTQRLAVVSNVVAACALVVAIIALWK